jgi:hypothetical protein
MIPRAILFGVFLAFIQDSTSAYLKCAQESCEEHAWRIYPTSVEEYPPEGPCGGSLGNNMYCQNQRLKVYYECQCGCIIVANQMNSSGKEPACTHRNKRIFSRPSASQAEFESSSSSSAIPHEMIGGHKYFKFL